jgi:hypothetical protein
MARSEFGYPRGGYRLLPIALVPYFGTLEVPPALIQQLGLQGTWHLRDLDERVWEQLPREAVEALADHVALVVTTRRRQLLRANEGVLAGPVPVELLHLSSRAENALLRHGVTDGRTVYSVALEQLARMRGVGGSSLLQILTAVEALRQRPLEDATVADAVGSGTTTNAERDETVADEDAAQRARAARISRAVRREAAKLAKRRWSKKVSRHDPRLGRELRALMPGAINPYAASQVLPSLDYDPAQARRTAGAIRALVSHGDALTRLALRAELEQILSAITRTDAQRVALRRRFGWDGRPPTTLEEAAQGIGVTRERVRQIEVKARKQLDSVWAPAFDRALRIVSNVRFATAAEMQQALRDAKLISDEFSLASLLRTARLLGRPVPAVSEQGGFLAHADVAQALAAIELQARRLTDRWGTTTVAELTSVLAEKGGDVDDAIVRRSLEAVSGIRYLDDGRNWFWLVGSRRNRLLNQARKIMSVAGSISLGELRDGVGRHHRMRGFRPPRAVLARLCDDTGLYRVEGDRVVGTEDLPDWHEVLGTNERLLAEALFEHGPVMRRTDLEELVVGESGMSRNSFWVYLTYSPILARYAPGVYGLRGASISAAEVSAMIPPLVRTKVLGEHGWTPDRRIWIVYQLSAAAAQTGVLSVPASLAPVLRGQFRLYTADDAPVGTAVIEETRLWGVSPFYLRRGVEAGDHVLLVLDLSKRTARIDAGDETIALQYQGEE